MGESMDNNAWGNYQLTREQTFGLYITISAILWAVGKLKLLFTPLNISFLLGYLIIYLFKFLTYPSSTIFHQLYLEGIHCRHYSYKLDAEISQLKSFIEILPKILSRNDKNSYDIKSNRLEFKNKRKGLITLITDIYNIYSSIYLSTNQGQASLTRDQTKLYTLLKLLLKGLANIPCVVKNGGKFSDKISRIDIYEDINVYTKTQVNNLCKLLNYECVPYIKCREPSFVTGNDLKLNFLSMFYYENRNFTDFTTATFENGYLVFYTNEQHINTVSDATNETSYYDDAEIIKNHLDWIFRVSSDAQMILATYFGFSSLTPIHLIKGLVTGQFDMLLGSNKLLKYESIIRFKAKIEKIKTENSEIDSLFFPSISFLNNASAMSKSIILSDEQLKFFRPVPKFNLPNDRKWLNIISLLLGSNIYALMYVGNYYKSEKIVLFFNPNAVCYEHLIIYGDTTGFYYKNGYSFLAYNYAGSGDSIGFATLKQAKKDACDIVKHLIAGLDDGHLYLASRSIGGSACAAAAATIRDSKIKTAIFDRTFGDMQGLAEEMYGKWTEFGLIAYPSGPCPIQCYISIDKLEKLIEFEPHDEIIPMPFNLASNVAEVLVQAFDIFKGKNVAELWKSDTRYSNMIAINYAKLIKEMPKDMEFISHGLNACGCTFLDIYTTYYRTPTLFKTALEAFVSLGVIWGSVNPISTGYKLDFGVDKYSYFRKQLVEYLNCNNLDTDSNMLPVDKQLVVDLMLFVDVLIKRPKFFIQDDVVFLDLSSIEIIEPSKTYQDLAMDMDKEDVYFTPGFGKPDTWSGRKHEYVEFSKGFEVDVGNVNFDRFSAWMRLWWRLGVMHARKLMKGIAGKSGKPKCDTAANILYNFFDELLIRTSKNSSSGKMEVLENFVFREVEDMDSKRGKLMPIACGHNGHHSTREDNMLALYYSERSK